MNFRTTLHLFKTDWRRLWPLIVLGWLLMLALAWPALTLQAGEIKPYTPRHLAPLDDPDSDRFWRIIQGSGDYLLSMVTILTAAALGFHAQDWSMARPMKRSSVVISKSVALILFLGLPLIGLSTLNLILRDFSASTVAAATARAALVILPRLAAACLFGAICGSLWRWGAGVIAFLSCCTVAGLLGIGIAGEVFLSDPFAINTGWNVIHILGAGTLILAVAALLLPTRLRTTPRIATTVALWLAGIWGICLWPKTTSDPTELQNEKWRQATTAWPDLSSRVGLTIAPPEIPARLHPTTESIQLWDQGRRTSSTLEINPQWSFTGVPEGSVASWEPIGQPILKQRDEIVATGLPRRSNPFPPGWEFRYDDRKAIVAALPSGGIFEPNSVYSPSRLNQRLPDLGWPGEVSPFSYMDPVLPDRIIDGAEVALNAEVMGSIYRYDRVVDASLRNPIRMEVDGIRIDVGWVETGVRNNYTRGRLIEEKGQAIQITHLTSTQAHYSQLWPGVHRTPPRDYSNWKVFIYQPSTGRLFPCDSRGQSGRNLLSGCAMFQSLYVPGDAFRKSPFPIEEARLIIVRPRVLGVMRTRIDSGPLKLSMGARREEPAIRLKPDLGRRHHIPSLTDRPDPATATAEEYWRWTMVAYGNPRSNWQKQDIISFLPRQLPLILQAEDSSLFTSSWAEALTAACPESRKGEVIGSLGSSRQWRESSWTGKVIQDRGWAKEAAPLLRDHLTAGADPWCRYITALVSAEDPALIPDLLAGIAHGLDIDTYEAIRQLPGIEPGLTEAIRKVHARSKQRTVTSDPEFRQNTRSVALTHGLPEAFVEYVEAWNRPPGDRSSRSWQDLSRYVLITPELRSRSIDAGSALTGLTAADFTWDLLARRWVFTSTR